MLRSDCAQTNSGAQAKTKNCKGVVQAPGAKTCVKTASNQGAISETEGRFGAREACESYGPPMAAL